MKQIAKKGAKNITGGIGENLAAYYLHQQGYSIVDSNYLKKWGEIDIVAQKGKNMHFVEVKTVSYETKEQLQYAVSHETWRPEDQVDERKLKKLGRAIETWVAEHTYEGTYQMDVMAVRIVEDELFASINLLENVILESK